MNPAYIVILLPYNYTQKLQEIIERYDQLKLATIVRQSYTILTEEVKPEHVLTRMSERYHTNTRLSPRPSLEGDYYRPTLNELKLINMVHIHGDSSPSKLCGMLGLSYWTVRSMIKKLQSKNVLYNVVYPTGVALGDPSAILVTGGEEFYQTIVNMFSTVSSTLLAYIRGQINGIWGLIYTKPHLTMPVIRSAKLLLKEKVRVFQPVISAESSGWQVPLKYYDEKNRMFTIDDALKRLDSQLETL